jgi:c-di-GMP-binding flagellar brake protein YcgR
MQNKRFCTRYRIDADTRIGTLDGKVYKGELVDLSAEGARVRLYDIPELSQGDIVYLLIKFKACNFKAKAEIRWIKADELIEMGLKFTEMTTENRQVLSEILREIAMASLEDSFLR